MRFRTCLGWCLASWSAALQGGGCSAPTAGSSNFASDAGSVPGVDAGAVGEASVFFGDASACAPSSVSTFVPVYEPTPRYSGACTADQLAAVIRDCFDPTTDSQTACNAWGSDDRNDDCRGCWRSGPVESTPAATTWGPYVFVANPGQTTYVNVSGCVVLAAPNELPCAQMIENDFACELSACEASCPVPIAGNTTNAIADLQDCFDSADVGGCSTYAKGARACRTTLAVDAATAFCFDAENGQPEALLEYFTLACGVPPADAGEFPPPDAALPDADVDGGATPDAGVTSDDAGENSEAGTSADAGASSDAGSNAEASPDASESVEGGVGSEAGADASADASDDAGTDAD